jgi:hypothetical protein
VDGFAGASPLAQSGATWWPLALLAEDAQQEEEEVDEVEVEREGAHDRRAPLGVARQPSLPIWLSFYMSYAVSAAKIPTPA